MRKTFAALSILFLAAAGTASAQDSGPLYSQTELASMSSSQLKKEFAKQLLSWGLSCTGDATKVGVEGVLETIPTVPSLLAAMAGTAHADHYGDYDDPAASYMWTLTDADHKTHGQDLVDAFLGGAVSSIAIPAYYKIYNLIYGNTTRAVQPPAHYLNYENTRTLFHDSFDKQYGSLCTSSAQAISDIRRELHARGSNVAQQDARATSAPLFGVKGSDGAQGLVGLSGSYEAGSIGGSCASNADSTW